MKGFGKQVKGVFSSKWSGWIFLAAVLQTMLPFFVKSMVLFVTKESQGNLLPLTVELATLLVSGAVLCIPVKRNGGAGGSFWLKGYLPYAAAVCCSGSSAMQQACFIIFCCLSRRFWLRQPLYI